MNHKVQKAITDYAMLSVGDKVVVALSGGADSVALTHALNSAKEKYNLILYACHVNHMIRGDEADYDEEFVRKMCDDMGIELFVKRVDVPTLANEQKISLELCGRNVRYEFFDELSHKLDAKVATAHTSSDNVETVLYNIARGTSVNGLCGIKPVRDYIIRPLIECTRKDVETYCEANKLKYVTDSTNLTDEYTRNCIRHNAVPVLEQVNPHLYSTVNRMCNSMADIKTFLDKYSKSELNKCKNDNGYSCEKLLELDNAVLTNALLMILKDAECETSYQHIDLIIKALKECGSVDLPGGKRAVCKQGTFRIVDTTEVENKDCNLEVPFKESEFVKYISKEELKNVNKKLLNHCINCDIISEKTVVRTRRDGDTFTFFDRGVTKSLKKLFNELKIPAEKRPSVLLVANDSTVLWIEGIGVSKQARVDKHCNGAFMIHRGIKDE